MSDMTAEVFKEKTGEDPVDDDLDRVNCAIAGELGHSSCGWCKECDHPRFMCLYGGKHPSA